MDEPRVIQVDDGPTQVIQLDAGDDSPTVVYVPGTGAGGGISEDDLTEALSDYATRDYVDAQVATGGDITGVQSLIDASVAAHRTDPTPHPAYDDLPSLSLLLRSRLV